MEQQFVDMDEDSKYEMACNIVKGTGITTISHLQRVLMIGYNRAARLIEKMEHDGIVSVEDYAGRRKLLSVKTT